MNSLKKMERDAALRKRHCGWRDDCAARNKDKLLTADGERVEPAAIARRPPACGTLPLQLLPNTKSKIK
jgi:hypothetical protein